VNCVSLADTSDHLPELPCRDSPLAVDGEDDIPL
jgi:hypothetical protein